MMVQTNGYPYIFDPQACHSCKGYCCRGSGGYVWITMEEMENLAAHRGLDLQAFSNMYLRTAEGKLALQERKFNGEHLCCFFDPFERRCMVYPHRPEQCRSYPFWDQFREDPQEVMEECPGVGLMREEQGERGTA